MIKNILLLWFIFIIVFIILIFKTPDFALKIESTLWINWLSQFLLWFKWTYDETVTNIPTKAELENAYDTVQSGALDFKDKFEDWLNLTKEKIDWVREKAWDIENTYNDLKWTYDEAKEFINTNSWKIEEIKEVIETISDVTWTLTNTWETN